MSPFPAFCASFIAYNITKGYKRNHAYLIPVDAHVKQ